MGFFRTALSVSFVTGFVFASHEGASNPTIERLVSGDATAHGGALVAGGRGARYELRGGPIVEVAAGSEFSFDPSRKVPLGRRGEPDTLTRVVRLVRGTIDVTVPAAKRDAVAVMVRGPGKMSSVTRGGSATFVALEDRSSVACRSGDTLVGVGNDWKALKEGLERTLAPEDPTAFPKPLISAPSPSFDRGLVFVQGSEHGKAEANWKAVKDATAYDVRVSRTDGKEPVPVSREVTSATVASLRDLSPGTYAVAVAAIDKSGVAGTPSEPRTLRVAGIEVPGGAVATDDGSIVLAKEQRVHLLGFEGLEVSYGKSRVYAPAPSTLGLANNEAVVARLRAPGAADETVIRLEPKGLRARIHVDPKAAVWPDDSVAVTVELYDAHGRPLPDNTEVKPIVTVNLEPVKLEWQRTGRVLRATVPPSAAPGPWVLRAEVRDGRGELIGRDFTEIAKAEFRSGSTARR